jgi:phosphate transporter
LIAILANFISSTVAAVLLLPVVAAAGDAIGHAQMMVLLCAVMTSGAMGLLVNIFFLFFPFFFHFSGQCGV